MCSGAARCLLEKARVALEEKDMKEKIEREGSEVDEGGEEAPVLILNKHSTETVEQLERGEDMTLNQY